MNMMEEMSWYIICQYIHSTNYYTFSHSFYKNKQTQSKEGEEEKRHNDETCNMINSCDNFEEFGNEESEVDVSDQ